jgi:hypothetical protein
MKCHVKNLTKKQKNCIHEIVLDHSKHVGGVNHKECDTADWTVSLKSNWWCLQIFCWLIHGMLHAACRVVCSVALDDNHKWHEDLSKNWGQHKLQMDFGLALLSHGLCMEWEEGFDEDKKPL